MEMASLLLWNVKTNSPVLEDRMQDQFNPATLTVTHTVGAPNGGGTAPGGAGLQKNSVQPTSYSEDLAMELIFDTSDTGANVQLQTLQIAAMMAAPNKDATKPLVQFLWGTFIFNGSILSMTETIDLFSPQGVPLRASVQLRMTGVATQKAQAAGSGAGAGFGASAGFSAGASFGASAGVSAGAGGGASAGAGFSASASLNAGVAAGTTPLTLAQSGDTLQGLSARAGVDWKAVAAANNIDNPRQIPAGTVLNLNASASLG
jgi:hypothetical protein